MDGQKTIELGNAASLVVQRANHPALFVDVHRNFFEKVTNSFGGFRHHISRTSRSMHVASNWIGCNIRILNPSNPNYIP